MADKRKHNITDSEEQCSTATPRAARPLKRRRIVTSSPLSDTARRLLLQKCSDSQADGHGSHETAPSETVSSTMVVEPVRSPTAQATVSTSQPSATPEIIDIISKKYPQLHIEKGTAESDQWLVVSRLEM